jgi:hypothetical protein
MEAFDERVLDRLARPDDLEAHVVRVRP